ncbi:FAD-binding oxidoreductase [Gilvimarinus algae]|uniref:FAD-binding oxidoreductase n=1 Tax=Gilvimarinus algae TaxID=3058037 RepID=A0ABT8TBW0_9GAMM|nr:FAD-binding oxidoreductase [Gilvimarinus sp. SDUM040014]MDO3381575.1 FAD-binding oxidoreductase [Gilvimarinus sp. SDUM040014]
MTIKTLSKALLLAGLLLPLFSAAESIRPFTSDGCSRFPNGTLEHAGLWLSCCEQHDLAYWRGGTYAERIAADDALEVCVAATGEPTIGLMMYFGVRLGGTPFAPTDFRWGYGWREYRGYRALNEQEQQAVQEAMNAMDPEWRIRLMLPAPR